MYTSIVFIIRQGGDCIMGIADCTENELKKISLLDDMEKKFRFDGL